jgi:hypothetical protein
LQGNAARRKRHRQAWLPVFMLREQGGKLVRIQVGEKQSRACGDVTS